MRHNCHAQACSAKHAPMQPRSWDACTMIPPASRPPAGSAAAELSGSENPAAFGGSLSRGAASPSQGAVGACVARTLRLGLDQVPGPVAGVVEVHELVLGALRLVASSAPTESERRLRPARAGRAELLAACGPGLRPSAICAAKERNTRVPSVRAEERAAPRCAARSTRRPGSVGLRGAPSRTGQCRA